MFSEYNLAAGDTQTLLPPFVRVISSISVSSLSRDLRLQIIVTCDQRRVFVFHRNIFDLPVAASEAINSTHSSAFSLARSLAASLTPRRLKAESNSDDSRVKRHVSLPLELNDANLTLTVPTLSK